MAVWQGATISVDEYVTSTLVSTSADTLAVDEFTLTALVPSRLDSIDVDEQVLTRLVRSRVATIDVEENTITQMNPYQLRYWDGVAWQRLPWFVFDGTTWTQVT